MEKPDEHPVNAFRRTPRRSDKNSNLNRRGMSNDNKTCFQCGRVYPHKVKCPAESKVCNKYKKVGHYTKCCKTKLTQKSNNPHPEQTLNRITHSPSVPKEHKNNSVDEVYSDNDKYLFAAKDLFKDQVSETREKFVTTVNIANQNVAALVVTGASVNISNMRTFNEINNILQKPLKLKRTKTKVCPYEKDDPTLKIPGELNRD